MLNAPAVPPVAPPLSRREKLAVAAILLLGFCYMFFYNSKPITALGGDQLVYDQLAVNMLEGHGFSQCVRAPFEPSVVRTPAYPALLAAVYAVAGKGNFEAVRLVQVLLMSLAALLVFMTALSAAGGRCPAFVALGLFSFYGFDYYSGMGVYGYLFTEPLVIFLVALSVFLLAGIIRGKGMSYCVLLGLSSGLALLTRPSNILFPAAMAVFMLWTGPLRRMWKLSAAMLFCCALLAAPWTLRNYVVFDKFIPVSASLQGLFLYGGMAYPPERPAGPRGKDHVPEVQVSPERRAEAEKASAGLYGQFLHGGPGGTDIFVHDAVLKRTGLALIAENRAVFVERWFYRLLSHWSLSDYSYLFYPRELTAGRLLKLAAKGVLVLLALYGLAANYRRPVFLALLLFPAYNTLMYTPLTSEYRYSLPARGFLFIIIAAGLCAAVRRFSPKGGN